jgi:hypothetical protein
MRNRTMAIGVFVTGLSVVAMAQTMAQRAPAGTGQPVTEALRSAWDGAKKNIKESADVMPEANYEFKPAVDVRSFGAILAHLAGANYEFCGAAKGEKAPHAEDEFEKSATTRPAIIKALADSLTYCDAAFAAATDRTLGDMVDMPFGMPRAARASALLGEIGHMNEHYGNLVTYFRIKGIVPPSSRR